MEDYLLADMMKAKEFKHMSEHEFMNKFKEIYAPKHSYNANREYPHDDYNMRSGYRMHKSADTFSHEDAKFIVADMYHFEQGKKHTGEYFDMHKAKEVKEMYNRILPDDVSEIDIYVAINAQYHDYSALFKSWNRNNVDHRVIESAIVFWFCDADYPGKSKVFDYFQMF
jgi:hypothetical protein